ncbi:hypothetical protein Salat_1835400 [Sesamum alatum]|uniref:Uncharacterized protein n=1 Tax=Sesamum alatum TaxID=300844 RepID=A0AAE1Y2N0_9LAMI|nr:hypothetical protein Salat_1835400 [Sesamum alatum]
MNARIAKQLRALREALPAGAPGPPKTETSVALSSEDLPSEQSDQPVGSGAQAPEVVVALEVASDDTNTVTQAKEYTPKSHTPNRDMGGSNSKEVEVEVEVTDAAGGLSEPRKCKRKHKHRNKILHSTESNKRSKSRSESRLAKRLLRELRRKKIPSY